MNRAWLIAWVCGGLAVGQPALGFPISADQDMDGGGDIVGDGAGNTITPTGTDPNWHYDWTGVSSPGLDLQGHNLYADDNDDGSVTLNLNGGNISGTGTTAVSTFPGVGTGRHADDLTITNVGTIEMGGIDAHADNGSHYQTPYSHAGFVTLGSPTHPAGTVRVAFLYSHAGNLTGNSGKGLAGDITIYGHGDVLIQDALGNLGDIRSHCYSHRGGHVTIRHQGNVRAGDILTWAKSNHSGGTIPTGNVTLDGENASGSCDIRSVDTSYYDANPTYGKNVGDVVIRNYAGVTASNLYAFNLAGNDAGHVTITNIAGDITIQGEINAYSANTAEIGALTLGTTDSGGSITLASLDLSKVKAATLYSATGRNLIVGPLIGFNVSDPANGALDAPPGQTVFYSRRPPENTYLHGASFALKSGGKLRSLAFGMVVVLK